MRNRPLLLLPIALLWFTGAFADIVNLEFKFTPFTGDPATADQVAAVPGTARVFLNEVPLAEQRVNRQDLPVMFEEREIAPAVWMPIASLGPGVRKGANTLRLEFEPADAQMPYRAQLRWAAVLDHVTEQSEAGRYSATNQDAGGVDERTGTGLMVFERRFTADFVPDRPWHHYPPVTTLDEADRQRLAALARSRAEAFKPKFEAVYALLEGREQVRPAEVRRLKCLDKAYAAGVRIALPLPEQIDFVLTGGQEVVVRHKTGVLYTPDPKPFARIKGNEAQMCAGIVLSMLYPPWLVAVRTPQGEWQIVD